MRDHSMPNYEMIGHIMCDVGKVTKQREPVCDRLGNLNSLKLAAYSCSRLHVSALTANSVHTYGCDGDGRTALSAPDSFICQTRPLTGDGGSVLEG